MMMYYKELYTRAIAERDAAIAERDKAVAERDKFLKQRNAAWGELAERDSIAERDATIAKCDGDHAGPRCADPECWNDDAINRGAL